MAKTDLVAARLGPQGGAGDHRWRHGAVGELLRVPGGSRLLVEAQVPYDELALARFLGFAPAQACSADTAIANGGKRQGARRPAGAGGHVELVGLGATAALASDRPRKGEHRFHIAFANAAGIAHCTGVMAKGRRDRAGEEDLVARAIVLWLAGPAELRHHRHAACSMRTSTMRRLSTPRRIASSNWWQASSNG